MKTPILTTLLFISLTPIPNAFGASADNPTFKDLSEKFVTNIIEFSNANSINRASIALTAQKLYKEISGLENNTSDQMAYLAKSMKTILKITKGFDQLKSTTANLQSMVAKKDTKVFEGPNPLNSHNQSSASNSSAVMLQPPATDSSFYGSDDDYYDGAENERIAQAVELSLKIKKNSATANNSSASCSNAAKCHDTSQNIEKHESFTSNSSKERIISKKEVNKLIDTHLLERLFNKKHYDHARQNKEKIATRSHQKNLGSLIDKSLISLKEEQKKEMLSNHNKCTQFIFEKLKNNADAQTLIGILGNDKAERLDLSPKYSFNIYRLGIHTLLWLTYAQGGTLLSKKVFTEKFAPKGKSESEMCERLREILSRICSPFEWNDSLFAKIPGDDFSLLSYAIHSLKLLDDPTLMGYELIEITNLLSMHPRWKTCGSPLPRIIKDLAKRNEPMKLQPLLSKLCDYELRATGDRPYRSTIIRRFDERLPKEEKPLPHYDEFKEFITKLPENLSLQNSYYYEASFEMLKKICKSSIKHSKKEIEEYNGMIAYGQLEKVNNKLYTKNSQVINKACEMNKASDEKLSTIISNSNKTVKTLVELIRIQENADAIQKNINTMIGKLPGYCFPYDLEY